MTEADARAVLQRFGAFADQFAPCFGRHVQRDALSRYLAGLVNDSARKSIQAMHNHLSDAGNYQALKQLTTDLGGQVTTGQSWTSENRIWTPPGCREEAIDVGLIEKRCSRILGLSVEDFASGP